MSYYSYENDDDVYERPRKRSQSDSSHCEPQMTLLKICITQFCDSYKIFQYLDQQSEESSDGSLYRCGKPVVRLLLRLSNTVRLRCVRVNQENQTQSRPDLVLRRLDDIISLATEKFYAFPFNEVPVWWRQLFREASLIKFSVLYLAGLGLSMSSNELADEAWTEPELSLFEATELILDEGSIGEMVRTIDMALIMAGPPPEDCSICEAITSTLDTLQLICASDNIKKTKLFPASFPSLEVSAPLLTSPIPRLLHPSTIAFEGRISNPRRPSLGPEPLIITETMGYWPAICEEGGRGWKNPQYLISKTLGGRRLVPVELGRSYMDDGWGQKIMAFNEFLSKYILHDVDADVPKAYLAQHDLLAQVPSLRNDILIPDYCYINLPPSHPTTSNISAPSPDSPLINAWFGPGGTITPLHHDPYHNLLAQVVGKKYIRLYPPQPAWIGGISTEAKQCPHFSYYPTPPSNGIDSSNTSLVDIGHLEGWDGALNGDFENFPRPSEDQNGKEYPYVECILEPGEMLYIPLGWWHYVRSLSTSFSVSFWF